MELANIEKKNKQFFSEKRVELQNKKNNGCELTEIEENILNHLNYIHSEERFWEKNRNL